MQGTKQNNQRQRPNELLSGQPRSARHTGKPVENGDAGGGMRAGKTSTGQEGGVKGEKGRGNQQTPGPGVGSLCDQLKIQTKQLYAINTAQTAMWA